MTLPVSSTPRREPRRAALMGCELATPGSSGPLKHYEEILAGRIAQHEGSVQIASHSLVVAEFEDAADAVNCAISVQEQVAQYNRLHLDEGSIGAKIGVHFGDVRPEDGRIAGSAVETLKSILPEIPSGKICLTKESYSRVRIHLHLKFDAVGTGVPPSAGLYSVDWEAVAGNLKASIMRLREDDLPRSMSLTSKLGVVPSKRASPIVMIFVLLFIFILFKFLKWM